MSDRAFDLPHSDKRWVIKSSNGLYQAYDHSLYTDDINIAALFMYPHKAKKYAGEMDEVVRVRVTISEL